MTKARPTASKARSDRPSLLEAVVIALVALTPVFFFRGTEEIFEVPKVALLCSGALLLGASALAGELGRLAAERAGAATAWARRAWTLPRRDPLTFALWIYLVSCVLSTFHSPNPEQSLFGAPESTAGLRTAFATAAVYFAMRSRRGTPERFRRVCVAAGLAAALAAGYALLQAMGADPLEWGRTATYGSRLRVFGTLGHPNFLGAYLAMTLPLVFHLWLSARGGTRVAWAVVAIASLAALVATLSRAAWIGFAAGAISWPLAWRLASSRRDEKTSSTSPLAAPTSRRSVAALVAVAAIVLAVLGLAAPSPLRSAIAARFHDLTDLTAPTTQTRIHIWRAGLGMAARAPLLGVGLDAFGTMFPAFRTTAYWRLEWGATPAKAHNEIVQILATQGLLGLLAALLTIGAVAAAAWRALGSRADATRRAAVAATAALIAFAVQDLASFTVVSIGVPAAALAGWLAAASESDERTTERTATRAPRRPTWAMALAAAAAIAAFVPLVLQPLRAQLAERRAMRMPERSRGRAEAFAAAARAAPWDPRYPAKLAFLHYRLAQDDPDPARRRALLAAAHVASARATSLEPQSGDYRVNLGEIEVEQALLAPPAATKAEAVATLHQAIAADTTNGLMLERIGFAMARLGRKDEAHAIALDLVELYPGLGAPLGLVGLLALDQGRTADGIDTLRIALAREWQDQNAARASAWSNLSVGYLRARRYREARDAAAEALRIDPTMKSARDNQALADAVLKTLGASGGSAR